MIKIRLARRGATHTPYYHVVVADVRKKRDGAFIEKIGTYNPLKAEEKFQFNVERVQYWLSVGAKATDRVYRALSSLNLVPSYVIKKQTKKDQPSKKTLDKLQSKKDSSAETTEAKT